MMVVVCYVFPYSRSHGAGLSDQGDAAREKGGDDQGGGGDEPELAAHHSLSERPSVRKLKPDPAQITSQVGDQGNCFTKP